ncbi:MAG: serine/threonine protein kinase, partial [Kofleriaceae bacterium]
MTDALRERFGKYHVLDKIAQGGMAEVYKVKTVGIAGFEKVQALKRILPHSAREGRFIRSFIDEARIAVELTHRNIVQVFDFGKADGELFLAMELIEGKDLRTALGQAVARELLPSIPIAAYIVSEVAAGLDYAHRKTDGYGGSLGIVHCDVSPSNVMLSSDGYVKILDFGIARASFASALERRRLRGKPRYMAPEQTLGEPPTPAADVFALGIIAWELFTGQPLFHGPDLKAILEAVRRVDAPRIDRINPAVPPGIAAAVATALDRDPSRRGSVADLLGACARMALQAGARTLAAWLAELDRRPDAAVVAWAPDVTSISVPRDDDSDEQPTAHAAPQLERSVTQSLSGARFLAELDAGAARGDAAARGARILPARTEVGATAPWASEHTLTGADAPDFGEDDAAEPSSTEPFVRPSYSTFTSLTALTAVNALSRNSQVSFGPSRPSTTRVDDEATAHGAAPPEDTRDDAIDSAVDDVVEDAMAAPAPAPAAIATVATEEPIDDDLNAMTTGVPGERRRTVVVAGVVAGAPRDQLRLLARSLGELAYQRGGVVLGLDDDALVVAFGLEVAGEDDVAVAMGWSLDASAMVRDAGGEHAGAAGLQVGAVTGVATQVGYDGAPRIPEDAIELARALAREAPPDRPMFAGGAGRLTSALYALREVPAPPRIRHSRLLEVLEV